MEKFSPSAICECILRPAHVQAVVHTTVGVHYHGKFSTHNVVTEKENTPADTCRLLKSRSTDLVPGIKYIKIDIAIRLPVWTREDRCATPVQMEDAMSHNFSQACS